MRLSFFRRVSYSQGFALCGIVVALFVAGEPYAYVARLFGLHIVTGWLAAALGLRFLIECIGRREPPSTPVR